MNTYKILLGALCLCSYSWADTPPEAAMSHSHTQMPKPADDSMHTRWDVNDSEPKSQAEMGQEGEFNETDASEEMQSESTNSDEGWGDFDAADGSDVEAADGNDLNTSDTDAMQEPSYSNGGEEEDAE